MRVLMLSRTTPYLPTHERPRLAAAHLLDQLSARHALALIAPRGRAETPAQRAWAAVRAQRFVQPRAGSWRSTLTGAPGDGLGAMRTAALRIIREWVPDVVHLDGDTWTAIARCYESLWARTADAGHTAVAA